MKEAGMTQGDENTLNLLFVFDAETLAPFEAALDKLLKVHPQLDAAVRELAKM